MGRVCALSLALMVAAGVAGAQPKVSDATKQKASELVKQAIAKSQAGEHEAAIDLYNQAYLLIPTPLLLSNIGSEYQRMSKRIEAVKYFCKYLAEDPNGPTVEYATAQVKTLQIELGNSIDEKDPCKVKPKEEPVVGGGVGAGSAGEGSGSGAGSSTSTSTSTSTAAQPAPSKTLEDAGIGVAGAGAIAFAIGTYYGFQAKSISDEISNHNKTMMWPADIKAREAEGQSDQTKQIVFMVGGGVVLAGGVVMAYLGHKHASEPADHVSLRPVATPTSVGIALGGGF